MLFLTKSEVWKNLDNFKLRIGNSQLEKVEKYKYLGLIIDSKLTWEDHGKYLSSKLSKTLGILFRTRNYLNKRSLFLIFNSLFLSHLRYGLICWGRCSNKVMKPLLILVNRAIRCILFLGHRENTIKYLAENNILLITDMFTLEVAKFMFRYNNHLLPTNFDSYFTKANTIHNHYTRFSKHNYQVPMSNSDKGLNSLAKLGTKVWSEIPNDIKVNPSVQSFVNSYKSILFKSYWTVYTDFTVNNTVLINVDLTLMPLCCCIYYYLFIFKPVYSS